MDNVAQAKRDKLENLAKIAGYNSLNNLVTSCGISTSNVYANFRGTWEMSVKRMFKLANACKVPVIDIMDIFYPELLEENTKIVEDAYEEG